MNSRALGQSVHARELHIALRRGETHDAVLAEQMFAKTLNRVESFAAVRAAMFCFATADRLVSLHAVLLQRVRVPRLSVQRRRQG